MDSAYDHIQEESYPQDPTPQSQASKDGAPATNFNTEIQDAYKAISSSPWAARLGGFLGTVKKQGEQYYDGASKQATAGISTLIQHTRNVSLTGAPTLTSTPDASSSTPAEPATRDPDAHPDRPESLPADIVKEAEGLLTRFRTEAAKRLKDIEKAEDAADEALLKFGTNIRSFLRDAVTIAPPTTDAEGKEGAVLFESKDISGKKVVHATRFDAQLHVIHSSLDSFLKDPVSPQWEAWKKSFDVEKKTEDIAKDLEKHAELRTAMEKCVPEKVEYGTFWLRYYFLRHVIESEEQRRREMLKASAPTEEDEASWDSDSEEEESDSSDDEDETSTSTPQAAKSTSNLAASRETLKPTPESSLKPDQPRRSNDEKSVADSDASYDLVSGATSRAPGSPQVQDKKVPEKKAVAEESSEESEEDSDEESDEEDWE